MGRGWRNGMMRSFSQVVTVTSLVLSGCADKAKPAFDLCVQADTAGNLAGAVTACTEAVGKDPKSASGKAAAERLATVTAKLAEKAEGDAKLISSCKAGETAACGVACDSGDPTSCLTVALADLASEGEDVQAKAEVPLTRACNGGVGRACYELGHNVVSFRLSTLSIGKRMAEIMDKVALAERHKEAVPFEVKGCDLNDGSACGLLAADYTNGEGVERNVVKAKELSEKAVKLLQKECDSGTRWGVDEKDGSPPSSCTTLGLAYGLGRNGVRKDIGKAKSLFKLGCEAKDAKACSSLKSLDQMAPRLSGPMHAAHVLVQWAGSTSSKQKRSKADALARAQEAKAKLDAGEDFATVASSYDDDAARARGGDLGTFAPGTFPKAFEIAASWLGVGDVSDIVETSFGYHIIKRLP